MAPKQTWTREPYLFFQPDSLQIFNTELFRLSKASIVLRYPAFLKSNVLMPLATHLKHGGSRRFGCRVDVPLQNQICNSSTTPHGRTCTTQMRPHCYLCYLDFYTLGYGCRALKVLHTKLAIEWPTKFTKMYSLTLNTSSLISLPVIGWLWSVSSFPLLQNAERRRGK